jgi:hypothetical protein
VQELGQDKKSGEPRNAAGAGRHVGLGCSVLRIVEEGCGVVTSSLAFWDKLKSFFNTQNAVTPDARRLKAESVLDLSTSLRLLPPGESGWITFREARLLFSHMDKDYAFGELDDAGKSNLASFAARREHPSSYSLMPVESRVYFTRKTSVT